MLGLILSASLAAAPAPPPLAEPEWTADALTVTARKGPALWRISKGEDEVWVMGSIAPLARNDWDASVVEQAISRAHIVYTPPSASVGLLAAAGVFLTGDYKIPGGKTLAEVSSPELLARLQADTARFDLKSADWRRLRPAWSAFVLAGSVEHARHWVRPDDKVELLARKHHVRVTPISNSNAQPVLKELDALSNETAAHCLSLALDDLEFQDAHTDAVTTAFAHGDLRAVKANYKAGDAFDCLTAAPLLKSMVARSYVDTANDVQSALDKHEKAFFVLGLNSLVHKGGVIELLRARGYTVEEPGD